ncbi:MAG: hypothetical protein WBQ17_17635 [Rhizomicrobium sp.]
MTDHDIPQQHPSRKSPFFYAGLFGILAAFCVLAMVVGDAHGWYFGLGVSADTSDLVFGIVTGVLFGGAIASLLKAKYRHDGAERSSIDEFQSIQRRMLIAIIVLVAGFGMMTIFNPWPNNGVVSTDFAIEFALLSVAAATAATFGVGFLRRRCRIAANDEFAKSLRARTAQIGYILGVSGLSAVYLLYLFRPDLVRAALPAALLIAVTAPAIYFLIADGRASADG